MNESLLKLKKDILATIEQTENVDQLEAIRIQYLSKKGEISLLMGQLRNIPVEQRPVFGQAVNQLKEEVEISLYQKRKDLENQMLLSILEQEKIDVTLPGHQFLKGGIHPLNQVIEDLEDFFIGMGYEVAEGPEIESDHYNFEMMNLEKDHPARGMQDTFYFDENTLLRTHTSPVQARTMLAKEGRPLRIICPGKVYRKDDDDQTHSHQFMQIEGLVIDQNITFANLKDVLLKMAQHLFGPERQIRLRPSYFPFTEPSVEVDVSYQKKDGSLGWIEILGAGSVHPNVLQMGGYDPKVFQGFAFGVGVERITMLKYKIDDLRHFYMNDLRFLKQFKGVKS